MTQQSHFWAYTPKKPELKETHLPQCSSPVSWGKLVLLWTFPLALLLLNPKGFVMLSSSFVSMHILISFLISSVTLYLKWISCYSWLEAEVASLTFLNCFVLSCEFLFNQLEYYDLQSSFLMAQYWYGEQIVSNRSLRKMEESRLASWGKRQ